MTFPVDLCDVSLWQDNNSTPQMVDFTKMLSAGMKGVYIKVSQSDYLDPDYILNWSHARDAGMPRGGYHYLDWTLSLVEQVRFFCGVLRSDPGEMTPCLDYECRLGVPEPGNARQQLHDGILEFEDKMGMSPLLYTGKDYWKNWGSADQWWLRSKLWFAYPTDNKDYLPPPPPLPWTSWLLWQWSWKGDGIKYGCESKQLDMDVFNGTLAEYYAWIGGEPNPPPVPQLLIATVNVPVLNLRSGPGTGYTDCGDVYLGNRFEIIDVDGLNSWVKINAHNVIGWIAVNQNGMIYSLVNKE